MHASRLRRLENSLNSLTHDQWAYQLYQDLTLCRSSCDHLKWPFYHQPTNSLQGYSQNFGTINNRVFQCGHNMFTLCSQRVQAEAELRHRSPWHFDVGKELATTIVCVVVAVKSKRAGQKWQLFAQLCKVCEVRKECSFPYTTENMFKSNFSFFPSI